MAYHVSKTAFYDLVERALAEVPAQFADFLEEVPVEVRDRPTRVQLKRVGTRRGDLLLGLYEGRPLTKRSIEDSGTIPDVISVFQENIELVSDSEDELISQVRQTVLHEIGHLFGMSEEDLD